MRVLLIALLAAISYAQTEDLFHIYGDCDFEDGCIGSKNRSHALMRAQKEECCIVTFKHDVQLYFFSYFDIHSDDRLTIRGKDVHSSDEVPMSLCKGETLVWRKKTSHATEGWEMCFETYENAICDAPDEAISETICEMTQAQTANGNINAVIFILILAAIITIIIAFCIWIWIEKCTKKKEGESFLLKSKDSLSVFGKGNFPSGPEQILIFDVPYPAAEAPYSPIENENGKPPISLQIMGIEESMPDVRRTCSLSFGGGSVPKTLSHSVSPPHAQLFVPGHSRSLSAKPSHYERIKTKSKSREFSSLAVEGRNYGGGEMSVDSSIRQGEFSADLSSKRDPQVRRRLATSDRITIRLHHY